MAKVAEALGCTWGGAIGVAPRGGLVLPIAHIAADRRRRESSERTIAVAIASTRFS